MKKRVRATFNQSTSLLRPSVSRRKGVIRVLAATLVLAATASTAFAQVMLVPAPAPRYEPVPTPRSGHEWRHGYWQWEHDRYTWAPGIWVEPDSAPEHGYYGRVEPSQVARPPRVERLSADALFPFDKGDVSEIRSSGLSDIAQIGARLRTEPSGHVEVRGYTDRLGGDSYNADLSQRRANSVKAALVEQGIPAAQIRAVGLGDRDPIVQCTNPPGPDLIHCLGPNRRVEIVTYVADDPRWSERSR